VFQFFIAFGLTAWYPTQERILNFSLTIHFRLLNPYLGDPRSDFQVKNEYMGFADFRAAFTPDSGLGFSVDPPEGSISKKEATIFTVRFQPQAPGITEGMLVIETEDFKKTWKVIGST
jgi:hypothetical protein